MKLIIEAGKMFVDNRHVCSAGAGHGKPSLKPGKALVVTDYCDELEAVLLRADGYGWMGPLAGCDIVVGQVRARASVIPCDSTFGNLFARVAECEEIGEKVFLEIV